MKLVPFYAVLDTNIESIVVSAGAGGTGQNSNITDATLAVRIIVPTSAAAIEYKVDSGNWQRVSGSEIREELIDLSTQTLLLRKSDGGSSVGIIIETDLSPTVFRASAAGPEIPINGVANLPQDLDDLGVKVNISTFYPLVHGEFSIKTFTNDYGAFHDEEIADGYNIDGAIATEPIFVTKKEIDYPALVRGVANIRTCESYEYFVGKLGVSAFTRAQMTSYVPQTETGGNGFINYAYRLIGDGYLNTPGGGGWKVYRGNDAQTADTSDTICGFDYDGFKPRNINCMVDTLLNITTATAANPMLLTLSSVSSLSPGSNLEIWSVDAASLANKGFTRLAELSSTEINIVSISGSVVTTNYDNTAATVTNAHKCKRPQSLINSYQGAFQKIGINRTIPSNSTDTFSAAGPASFYSSVISLFDTTAAPSYFYHTKTTNTYQTNRYFKGAHSADIGFGFMQDNASAVMGWGLFQGTETNFKQNIAYATVGANGIGAGPTSATAQAFLRIADGTATKGQILLNTQADFTGTVPAGQLIIWAATDGTIKKRFGTTTQTITAV